MWLSRQDQIAAQMGQRVAQSVAQFEQIGAHTEARATQAQTSSAAAVTDCIAGDCYRCSGSQRSLPGALDRI